jgi:hypothetical protein
MPTRSALAFFYQTSALIIALGTQLLSIRAAFEPEQARKTDQAIKDNPVSF